MNNKRYHREEMELFPPGPDGAAGLVEDEEEKPKAIEYASDGENEKNENRFFITEDEVLTKQPK